MKTKLQAVLMAIALSAACSFGCFWQIDARSQISLQKPSDPSPQLSQGPDCSHNFVVGTVVRVSGAKDTAAVNALPSGGAMRTVSYYDGLGFPSQTVSVGAVGGGAHDLVLHKEYDRYMRESKVFLPYADLAGGSGQGFRDGAGAATAEFYRDGSLTGMSPDLAPWSVTVYGNSTLDRVLEQGFPGEVWQPSSQRTDTSGRTQAYAYGTCSSSGDDVVRLWKVTSGGISSSGDYLPGRLVRQTLMGENWVSGRDGTVDVFTDYSGRTVLERRWLSEDGVERALDTYYVYDVCGRLRYVLPPLLSDALSDVSSASDDDSVMKAYAYVYRYDGLGECIWKRLPGCSPVTMQYDVHRRPVLSQDGNQALSGEWTSVWYDGLGRPCVRACGPLPYSGDVSGTEFTASYTGESGPACGYLLSHSLPSGSEFVDVTYYDNYDFISLAPESCRDSLRAYVLKPVVVNPPVAPFPPVKDSTLIPPIKDSTLVPFIIKDSATLTPVPLPVLKLPVVTTEYDRYGSSRVTGAEWLSGGTPASGYGTSYSYDGQGNVLSVARERDESPEDGDDLMMAYVGNRLHAMSDHGGSMIPDFLAGSVPSGMTQYAYDANGNMTRDLNSGLTVMSYNRMNLPEELTCVSSDGVHSIRYLYSPEGVKLRVSVSGSGDVSAVTDYASSVVYRDGAVERVLVPGGYMTDGSYRFFLTDHLGSVRAVADSEGNVLETYDYYPYGVEFPEGAAADADVVASVQSGVSDAVAGLGVSVQPYRFNGKESQEFAGLPYLDYGARFYHPLSSRWTTMDPMAEKYYSVSPYAFCSNNPVNFVDWDGMAVWVLDEQSRNNIVNTLTKEEAKYVKFNSDGKLNTRRLNKSDSQSENMTALKSLANSDISYNFQTSTGYPDANGEHKEFKNGKESWENGITLIPGAESDPSPDGNVYIITNSSLSAEDQASNTAHEAYGHAYFYELQQQGHDVNPFHNYKFVNGEEVFDEFTGLTVTTVLWIDTNIQLNKQIKKVEKQARNNYNSRLR